MFSWALCRRRWLMMQVLEERWVLLDCQIAVSHTHSFIHWFIDSLIDWINRSIDRSCDFVCGVGGFEILSVVVIEVVDDEEYGETDWDRSSVVGRKLEAQKTHTDEKRSGSGRIPWNKFWRWIGERKIVCDVSWKKVEGCKYTKLRVWVKLLIMVNDVDRMMEIRWLNCWK